MVYHNPLTKRQEAKIRREYLTKPVKRLASEFGVTYGTIVRRLKKWGLVVPKKIREERKRIAQYKKGSVSYNKGKKQSEYMSKEAIARSSVTRFQPGQLPHNTKYDGYERVDYDGYVLIRLGVKNSVHKHRYEWEKVNGKVPEGYLLNCIDGDKANWKPDNWTLVSRQEHMLKNSIHKIPKELIPSMILRGKINKKIKNYQDAAK